MPNLQQRKSVNQYKKNHSATCANGEVTIQVSNELMDDFVFSTDLTGITDIHAITDYNGNSRLFYIGQSNNIMSLFVDEMSDTGWSEQELNNQFHPVRVKGANLNQKSYAIAIGANEAAPDLYYSELQSDGTFTDWVAIMVGDNVPPFMVVTEINTTVVNGKPYLFAFLNNTPGENNNLPGIWQIDFLNTMPTWNMICESDQSIMEFCTLAGNNGNLLYAVSSSENPTNKDFLILSPPFTGVPALLTSEISFTSLTIAQQADNNSLIVIADNGYNSSIRQISILNGANPQAGFTTINTSLTASTIVATDAGKTHPLNIFALDYRGVLYLLPSTGTDTWGEEIDMSLLFNSLVCCKNKEGVGELLGYNKTKGIMRYWQSMPTEGKPDSWNQAPIKYVVKNQSVSQQNSFTTVITLLDGTGCHMAYQNFELRATELIVGFIDGQYEMIGPDNPINCITDGSGRIRITTIASALNTARYSVNLPGIMDSLDEFWITPNADIQNRLTVITEQDIKTIKPDITDPTGAVAAIHNIMGAIKSNSEISPVRFRTRSSNKIGTPIIGIPNLKPMHLHFNNGELVCKYLSGAEAEEMMRQFINHPRYTLNGFFDFFNDIVDAIENAAESLADFVVDYVVNPVVNAIEVAVTFIIDGITYVYNGAISVLEDAFNAVEIVFNAIKTVFKELYNFFAWLLSGARKDIWATKQKFETYLQSAVTALPVYAKQGQRVSKTFFSSTGNSINASFTNIEIGLNGFDMAEGLNSGLPALKRSDGLESIMEILNDSLAVASWLADKVADIVFGSVSFDVSVLQKIHSDLDTLLNSIADKVSEQLISQLTAFISAINSIATTASSFESALLSTILEATKDLLLFVLNCADSLTEDFLTLVGDDLVIIMNAVFNTTIDNWFVKGIYNLINPYSNENVTLLRLACLIAAFPATVSYHVMFGDPPYPRETNNTKTLVGPLYKQGLIIEKPILTNAGTDLIMSGIVYTWWTFPDILADASTDHGIKKEIFNACLLFMPLVSHVLAWPGGPCSEPDFSSDLNKYKWAAYFAGYSSTIVKIAYFINSDFQAGPRKTEIGRCLLFFCGAVSLSLNTAQFWLMWQEKNKPSAERIIPLFSAPLSPMIKPANDKRLKILVDFVSDGTTGVCRIITGVKI